MNKFFGVILLKKSLFIGFFSINENLSNIAEGLGFRSSFIEKIGGFNILS